MNKIFKVIWNRTTQSLVVTSELAKGQVKSSSDTSISTVSSSINRLFKLSAIAVVVNKSTSTVWQYLKKRGY